MSHTTLLDRAFKFSVVALTAICSFVLALEVLSPESHVRKLFARGQEAHDTAEQVSNDTAPVAATAASMDLRRIPQIPPHQFVPAFNRLDILSDPENRISEDFLVPPGLQDRVGFWFDIYSRYDSNKRVIHHSEFPWIIFKVVDVEPIVHATYPKFRWQRNQLADELVKKELENVRKTLRTIAAKKNLAQLETARLTADEVIVRDALLQLKGDVRRRARQAGSFVRVQTGQRNFFAEGLQTAPRYMTAMEEIFVRHKLPTELTRLPLVESSFNKHAKSKVGAAGIWQFMETTGKKKKLVINELVDERKSPFKATDAAARLLKENHMILHRSWPLAVTAWNHGPGGVRTASRAAGTRDLARIIEVYSSKRFSFASENFYAEFLAALYTEKYSDRIFPGLPKHAPLIIHELKLTRSMKVDDILRVAAITLDEFKDINPDMLPLIQKKRPLHKGLRIHIPKDALSAVQFLMAGGKEDTRLIGAND
jgi:membrane-bound lytic murein transglycosylase D